MRSLYRLIPAVNLFSSAISLPLYLALHDILPFPAVMMISFVVKCFVVARDFRHVPDLVVY